MCGILSCCHCKSSQFQIISFNHSIIGDACFPLLISISRQSEPPTIEKQRLFADRACGELSGHC